VSEHQVVDVRVTGRTPEAVAENIQQILAEREDQDWDLQTVQPVIYNSSTTGYFLLFFRRG
jgi:broad-specificity NMP kinase